jgi:uncharacterized membrane protein YoaK (UPF0700 family)
MGMSVLIPFLLIVLLGLFAPILYGLFNRNPKPLLALPALLLIGIAALGGLHAWGEGRDIGWTVTYAVIGMCSMVAAMRQLRPAESE